MISTVSRPRGDHFVQPIAYSMAGFEYDAAARRHQVANADSWLRRENVPSVDVSVRDAYRANSSVRIRPHLSEWSFALIPVVYDELLTEPRRQVSRCELSKDPNG